MLRVLFMGTPAFALPALEAVAAHHRLVAVITRPDRPRGRGCRPSPPPVKRWALDHGVPVEQPSTLRHRQAQERIAAHRPEVIVVVAYGLILPAEVLAIPPRGCINLHASLLPRHRGAAPVAWAILEGDRQTGVTTMLMDEGLDTGPILMQRQEAIGERETAPALAERLARRGAELLAQTLDCWEAGELTPRPQQEEAATLAPRFSKEDGVVEWDQPALAIDRRVRALQPWPVAHTRLLGARLLLWWVEPHSSAAERCQPGRVVRSDDGGLWVCCADGELVQITELQLSGRQRMGAADFLRGHPVPAGTLLGDRGDQGA